MGLAMFGFKPHSFLFIIRCSSLVKVFQYWCQKTWQTQVYFLTEANFLRIWCKSQSDEREYHYLSLISFEQHTILPDGIGQCLKRARGRKYSTINVSKFLPASNCSKKTFRNQITYFFCLRIGHFSVIFKKSSLPAGKLFCCPSR